MARGDEHRMLQTQLDGPKGMEGRQSTERSVRGDRQETQNTTQTLETRISQVRTRSTSKHRNKIDQKRPVSADLQQPKLITKTNTG